MTTVVNALTNTRIEFHILQSFPVTCLNRDDVGAPKTALVGGVTRARVSSQAWKRPVRLALKEFGIKLAVRTKKVSEMVSKCAIELGASDELAQSCGDEIAKFLAKDTLLFFTETEALAFAEFAQGKEFDCKQIKEKEIHRISRKTINPAVDGLDIALFGRMVAQASELNVEAAVSFAHAISTHRVSNEVEFFTALDDLKIEEESGSAHMGSLEFNSATYYRYISLDLGQLSETLSGVGLPEAVEAFTKALFVAIPTARQATQSGASAWDYAKVLVRNGQRLQLPFDQPVKQNGMGYLKPSIERLNNELNGKEKMAGTLFGKIADYTLSIDSAFNVDDLVEALKNHASVEL